MKLYDGTIRVHLLLEYGTIKKPAIHTHKKKLLFPQMTSFKHINHRPKKRKELLTDTS